MKGCRQDARLAHDSPCWSKSCGRKVVAAKCEIRVAPDPNVTCVAKKNGRTNYNLRFGTKAAMGARRSAEISKPVLKEDAWAMMLG
jgi:hypothetical protein